MSNWDIAIGFLIIVGCFIYWVNAKYRGGDGEGEV